MSSNYCKEGFPWLAYEADDYHKITAPYTSVLEYERFLISQALGTSDEGKYPFYALDNIGRIIRVFETEGRIFLKNRNGKSRYISNCPRDLAHEVYRSIRGKIAGLYGGQPGAKGLVCLLNNLDSIQIITSEDKIKKIIFIMKNYSAKHFNELNENTKSPNGDYLN